MDIYNELLYLINLYVRGEKINTNK